MKKNHQEEHGDKKTDSPSADDLRAIFGRNLKTARTSAKLKQSDLANMLGVKQQYISSIEGGRIPISLNAMASLARLVGSDVTTLLTTQKANDE
jgi:transcriptional regulator with XRE-family HTH domain